MFDYTAHGLIESVVKKALPGDGPQTIGTILDRSLSRGPNRTALVGPSGRYSYAELEWQVAQAAAVFYELGVRQYDRVAACLPNDVDIVIALLGCARAPLGSAQAPLGSAQAPLGSTQAPLASTPAPLGSAPGA